MLIVKVENGTSLEKALKILKRKWDKSKAMKELRERKEFKKKSVKRIQEILKASYVQKKYRNID